MCLLAIMYLHLTHTSSMLNIDQKFKLDFLSLQLAQFSLRWKIRSMAICKCKVLSDIAYLVVYSPYLVNICKM